MDTDIQDQLKYYAKYIVEDVREKLGYQYNDTSHDQEVLEYLTRGEKLSKSKHLTND